MKSVPKANRAHFCPKCTAIALGSVWAATILLTGWISMSGWGSNFVGVLSSIYTGYSPSFVGGIIGGIWGFAFGGLIGFSFAAVHNRMACR